MVQSLTFIDCSSCGKRIRSNALKCHYCHQSNLPRTSVSHPFASDGQIGPVGNPVISGNPVIPRKAARKIEDHDADSHMASVGGGYDEHADDFDYEEYLAEEFPNQAAQKPQSRVKRWVWVTAWVLIFVTLLPYLYYVLVIAA